MGKDTQGRKFVGIHFACCNVYRRLYLEKGKKEYRMVCPRCGRWAAFVAGKDAPPGMFVEVG